MIKFSIYLSNFTHITDQYSSNQMSDRLFLGLDCNKSRTAPATSKLSTGQQYALSV